MASKGTGRKRRLPRGGARHSIRLPLLRRRRWTNHTGNQGVDPVAIVPAQDDADLAAAVARAHADELTVRTVGSGHSWSDVAVTTGYMVAPGGLTGAERLDPALVRAGVDASMLVSVRSGTTIKAINAWLDSEGLALVQMGGYDGQTLAGVVSTSTHGSGIAFPPFPDYVRSLDLVDGRGGRRRIERRDGPTDPAAFAQQRPGWTLTQEDDWFDAVTCGMGCMGLIVSLVIEVREAFRLTEVRVRSDWKTVSAQLRVGAPAEHEHYEVYVNPYPEDGPGSNRCIVTTRAEERGRGGAGHRPWIPELLGHLPWLTAGFVQLVSAIAPERIPGLIDRALSAIECPGGYTNASYRVYNIGSANNLWAYSAEMAVPTAENRHVDAIERVIEVAKRYREEGAIYHTSFVACRFVARSRALMSMMHDRETMTMELIQLIDTDGGQEILAAHEEALAEFDVRPHWGQINTLACGAELAARYPRLSTWQQVRAELDPDGVFASPFSKRVGLSPLGFSSAPAPRGA
jgi:FAD/FMN-containing dehydrogenase